MNEPSFRVTNVGGQGPSQWSPAHVGAIAPDSGHVAPLIGERDFSRFAGIEVWDAWPVQDADGRPAVLGDGVTLWMALAAPNSADPDERHGRASIHLFQRDRSGWTPLGPVMPDGFSPGSREWSGSAVLADDGRSLSLYFTATGKRGEAEPSFVQRLFSARAQLEGTPGSYRFGGWHGLEEAVVRDAALY